MTEQEREDAIEELLCYADCFVSGSHEGRLSLSPLALQADKAVEGVKGRLPIYLSWCVTDALEAAHLLMDGWNPGKMWREFHDRGREERGILRRVAGR